MRAVRQVGSTGNFTCEFSCSLSKLEKVIPRVCVPFRYLITCFAACICPFDAVVEYFAKKIVIGAISGLVDIASQLSKPTRVWNRLFCFSCWASVMSVSSGIVSTA